MKNPAKILVDLDSLLDTRAGTLAKINPEAAVQALTLDYYNREWDDFKGFNQSEFLAAYHARDIETLELSILSGMYYFLMARFSDIRRQIIEEKVYDGIELIINVYPYKLDQDDMDAIGVAMSTHFTTIESVKVVNMSYDELDAEYCSSFVALILYDWHDWCNARKEWSMVDGCLPKGLRTIFDVTVWAPATYKKEPPTEAEMLEYKAEHDVHPFKELEFNCTPLFRLEFIHVRYFCLVREGINDKA